MQSGGFGTSTRDFEDVLLGTEVRGLLGLYLHFCVSRGLSTEADSKCENSLMLLGIRPFVQLFCGMVSLCFVGHFVSRDTKLHSTPLGRTCPDQALRFAAGILSMCASSGQAAHWDHIDWPKCEHPVRRLQARVVKATRRGMIRRETGFAHAGLCIGLSRMRRKSNVRFLAEGVVVRPPPYPGHR
jgi:hypothetical protein